MITIVVSGSVYAPIEADSVTRTFDANSPPRPLVETFTLKGVVKAVVTNTYTSSGASLVPTSTVRVDK